ncbi:hypothetical protein KKE14_02940 [Patescibacteria group bacterium]|nr:hypothetical protein [Patescibacteria group bacterium]
MNQTNLYERIVKNTETPVFVYWQKRLEINLDKIFQAANRHMKGRVIEVAVPYFTNSNPHLFSIIKQKGCSIVVQTVEEWHQLDAHALTDNLIASPTVLPEQDMMFFMSKNVPINLASIDDVVWQINHFPVHPLFVRFDISVDSAQRMGIKIGEVDKLKQILNRYNTKLKGIHIYVGTFSKLDKIIRLTSTILDLVSREFPDIEVINLGGGFSYNYDKALNQHFDWDTYFEMLAQKIKLHGISPNTKFVIEPGRDVLADVGELILSSHHVFWNSQKTIGQIFTDGSYVYMPSATIRSRQHQLMFLSSQFEELTDRSAMGRINGCTTLSSDFVLPMFVEIPSNITPDCFVVVKDIGAYGATQHMEFLNKKPCPEVLVASNNYPYLITARGREDDKIRYLLTNPIRI